MISDIISVRGKWFTKKVTSEKKMLLQTWPFHTRRSERIHKHINTDHSCWHK